ncbi:MAG: DUF5060 domain-containing protein [Christensenellales bacterium]|jgi:hypothetical protein
MKHRLLTEQWKALDIRLVDAGGKKEVDCGISLRFSSPTGRNLRLSACWDGDDGYLVRFAPTEPGIWTYETEGLSGGQVLLGEVECRPYSGTAALYMHGFLKVGPQGRYLCHADNTPFFWLGDTHWQFAVRESFDVSNDPRFDSQFCAVVDKRVKQRFTVYQCNFHCEFAPDEHTPKYFIFQNGTWRPNLFFFSEQPGQENGLFSRTRSGHCHWVVLVPVHPARRRG